MLVEDTLAQFIGSNESEDFRGGAEVRFITLEQKKVFDKRQCRQGGIAKQRIEDGIINVVAWSPVQIMGICVWVFREEQAAELFGDRNGRVSLPVQYGKLDGERVCFC